MRSLHALLSARLVLLLVFATSCGVSRPPVAEQATPVPTPAAVLVPDLLQEPQRWSGQEVIVIAPLIIRDELRALAPLHTETDPARMIWLADAPPDDIVNELDQDTALARLTGRLSPPGAYGVEQRFPYQFSAASIEALQPERTTIANLALNPGALDAMPLRLAGTLLAQPGGALLVDEVSESGVPTSGAHQIKLDPATLDESVLAELQQSGDVRWGAVEVVGWWQDRTLTPLGVAPREQR